MLLPLWPSEGGAKARSWTLQNLASLLRPEEEGRFLATVRQKKVGQGFCSSVSISFFLVFFHTSNLSSMIAGSNLRQGRLRHGLFFSFEGACPEKLDGCLCLLIAKLKSDQGTYVPRSPWEGTPINGWAFWTASSKATHVEMKPCLLCRARCNSFCWSLGGTSTGCIKRPWAMHWWKTSHNFLQCLH